MNVIREFVERAKADPAYHEIHRAFASETISNWLSEDEKALHFAVGAYASSGGHIVEIGSYEGGSACFLGAGVKRRGAGRLTCIDPHLGGPTWLGMVPFQRTLNTFLRGTKSCGVSDWIQAKVGDSVAVSAVWPNDPVDTVFIDGDHSFSGALKDFECWGPKVAPGGYIMIDDADDLCLPELLEMINFVRTLDSVEYLDTVDGIAVFQKRDVGGWQMLEELSRALDKRGLRRPWDWSLFHKTNLPAHYLKSKSWTENDLDTAYQLCFLARCGAGPYGYTAATPPADREVLRALSADRGDGQVVEMSGTGGPVDGPKGKARGGLRGLFGRPQGGQADGPNAEPQAGFRAIFCRPEEAKNLAHLLLPGGVLISRQHEARDPASELKNRQVLLDAGLEGCGYGNQGVHWGVRQPHYLASDAIFDYAASNAA